MKKDLIKIKERLIELGYLDNEYLDKYLEVIKANLETKRNRKSTQAHHAIPVNAYWTMSEPYKRAEALKFARADKINFEVHLLYKDHLLVHSYLTLCTDLTLVQLRYEAQEELRKQNSFIASNVKNAARGNLYIYKTAEDKVINKIISPIEVQNYLELGWSLGRKPNPTRCYVYKDGEYKNISIKQLNSCLQQGWTEVLINKK